MSVNTLIHAMSGNFFGGTHTLRTKQAGGTVPRAGSDGIHAAHEHPHLPPSITGRVHLFSDTAGFDSLQTCEAITSTPRTVGRQRSAAPRLQRCIQLSPRFYSVDRGFTVAVAKKPACYGKPQRLLKSSQLKALPRKMQVDQLPRIQCS